MVSRRRVRRRLHGSGRANQVNLTGINDLPDETILEVIKDMDDESLFRLSMTSRRFNSFALPILFQRHEIKPGFSIFLPLNQLPRFILTALRTALFLRGCSRLCIAGLSSVSQRLKQELHNLLLLVKQWPGLSSLALNFNTSLWENVAINISIWKQTFIALLDVASTQCMELEVTGPSGFCGSSNDVKAVNPQTRSSPNRPSIKTTSRVSRLTLHPSLLLMPQFYHKTISVLSNPSTTISSLSLSCITSAETASNLLQDLTIPSLSTFIFHTTLPNASLSLKELAAFLCRHHSIKIMEIYYAFTPGKFLIPTPSLPNLNRLCAYPKSMSWFLASARKLPALTDIGILFEDASSSIFHDVFVAITRIQRDVHVSFITSADPLPFQRWARSCITARISRKHDIRSLFNVKNLTIRAVWPISEDFKMTFVSWLALFSNLRRVDIWGEVSGEDWKNPESDFMKLVASTCTGLHAIGHYSKYIQLNALRN